MDKKKMNIIRDVRSGNQLEENIPQLFNIIATQYHTYAQIQLAMHYGTLYEAYTEEGETWSIESKEMLALLNQVIQRNLIAAPIGSEREEIIRQLDELRNGVMKRMRLLTAYTDIFQNYEYILNRVEYRFKEELILQEENEFAREVLQYIFDTQDNMIINEKIKEIIGQLPIRMTKQKYFDLLKDSLRLYIGADRTSFDTYLYLLRTNAMLNQDEDMEKYYPNLWKYSAFLSGLKYQEITKQEFDEAKQELIEATGFLVGETSIYYSLQEIINEVYAILLCEPYAGMELAAEHQREQRVSIIRMVHEAFLANKNKDITDILTEKYASMEGLQEELSYELTVLEDALFEVDHSYRKLAEGMMLEKLLNVLLRSKDLLSSSIFIDWNERKENQIVEESFVMSEADQLISELSNLFSKHDRALSRAVMANTLSAMPVFFQDHKEVMDYVRYSIERCSDPFERFACMEIISDIMNN
jgi:hypothetical protein